ncbi:MAG: outer membrane beta-barrel protein, partial [Deltaproteobacteria bacterium]|nr:outer membrane beta-barrel protein [Deltaproteobacteria bacterium]
MPRIDFQKLLRVISFVLGVGLISGTLLAEEASQGSLPFWQKTKVSGSADLNYNFNFNQPNMTPSVAPAGNNAYRVFDSAANTFNVGLVELAIENSPTDWVTFRTDLDFGHDVSGFHAAGLGTTEFFDLQQAYMALKVESLGNGLTVKAGKFVTMHGAEVIEAAGNYNISRGLLFNFAIPLTHTGVVFSYPFADWITVDAGIVNGWNNVIDNNSGKSGHFMLTIKPVDKFTFLLGGTVGPEAAGTNSTIRTLIDTSLIYALNEKWSFSLNYDLGRDGGLGGTNGIADWQGLAYYVHWKPIDRFGLTLRGEYFRDDLATKPAAPAPATGMTAGAVTGAVASTKIYEGTLTSHFY